MSRRAILADFARRGDTAGLDVVDLAKPARAGDPPAPDVVHAASTALGTAISPWLRRFAAQVLVIGGTVSASWDLVGPARQAGVGGTGIAVVRARHLEEAGEIGTAWPVVSQENRQ